MRSPRLNDVRTSGLRVWLWWFFPWWVWWVLDKLLFRQRSLYADRIPQDRPFLLLGNHASALDPFWAGFGIGRPSAYMASAHIFRFPFLGWLLGSLGAFPKVKFVKDRESMQTLQRIYDEGRVVTLFPEGTRSWDGRVQPVLPGIGRLVRRMGANVVCVRNRTGHLAWPRWATYPRYVPIELEYGPPLTWPEDTPVERIVADVQAGITVDAAYEPARFAWGWRTAWGLPDLLFACPRCLAWRGLEVDPQSGDHARCGACAARWRVTAKGVLEPEHADGARECVAAAFDRLAAHFGELPRVDPARFEAEGVVLVGEDVSVGLLERGEREPVPQGHGTLVLYRDRLELHSSAEAVAWRLDLAEIVAVSVELAGVLQLRTAEHLFQVDPTGESTFTWSWFVRPWCALARGEEHVARLPAVATGGDSR